MSSPVLDTLRLTQPEVERFLNDLEKAAGGTAEAKRHYRRWRMQYQRSVLTLLDDEERQSHFTVVPRNLSVDGVGLLLGTFVHPGTRCVMVLRCADGTVRMHQGLVARCRLYKRHVHDVGVVFESHINPLEYLVAQSSDLRFNVERVNLATLAGSILVVDPDVKRQGELAAAFNGSTVTVKGVTSGVEARAALGSAPHIIFVNETLPDGDACAFVRQARADGNVMPMVVMAAKVTPELRSRALEAGAHEVLEIGCAPLVLHRAAAEFLPLRVLELEAPKVAEKKEGEGEEKAGEEKRAA